MFNRVTPGKEHDEEKLTVCNDSDAPMILYPPKYRIYVAMSRQSFKGLEVNRLKSVSV